MYTIKNFKDDLLGTMRENIVSLAIYGSAAAEDVTKQYSDLNTLLIVNDAGMATLKTIQPFVHRWNKAGNPPPLVFSLAGLRNSQDVFAIEFLDINASHQVVYGADPFTDLRPGREALRHQLEFELRSKLLALQKHYFEADGKTKHYQHVMAKSLSSFTVLAKTALHLNDKPVPAKKTDVWHAMSDLMNVDTHVIETIFEIRQQKKEALRQDAELLFGQYMALITRMAEFVDGFVAKK